MHLYFIIHRTYYLSFKLHEIINKHVLAHVCYYSFYFEMLMIHDFFISNVKICFKRYFTIYVILDFTPYEKNVQIKLTPKNFLLIIFNVVYIEVNETRKKL